MKNYNRSHYREDGILYLDNSPYVIGEGNGSWSLLWNALTSDDSEDGDSHSGGFDQKEYEYEPSSSPIKQQEQIVAQTLKAVLGAERSGPSGQTPAQEEQQPLRQQQGLPLGGGSGGRGAG